MDSFYSAKGGQSRASPVSFLECRLWQWQNLVRNPSLHDHSLSFTLMPRSSANLQRQEMLSN